MPFKAIVVKCSNCGSTIHFDPIFKVANCAFCNTHLVVENAMSGSDDTTDVIEKIFQNKVSKEQQNAIVSKFMCGDVDCPDEILDSHEVSDNCCTYIPFFNYFVDYDVHWTAEAGYYYYEENKIWNNSRKAWEIKKEKLIRWEPVSDSFSGSTVAIVPASKIAQDLKFNERLCLLIQPLTKMTNDIIDYNPEYLKGCSWLSIDTDPVISFNKFCESDMEKLIHEHVKKIIPGDKNRKANVSIKYNNPSSIIAIPFWLYNYKYKNKSYNIIIDGVLGNAQGDLPKKKGRVALMIGYSFMMAAVLLIYFIKNDAERNFIHIAFMLSCLGLASLLPYIYRKVIKKKKTKLAEMNKEDRTKEIESIKKIEKNTLIIMGASLMVVIIWLILLLQYSTII